MNERIKELADQARKKPLGDSWTYRYFSEFEEKFAELIIRECADVGSKFSQAHPEDIRYQIKKHFGFEE